MYIILSGLFKIKLYKILLALIICKAKLCGQPFVRWRPSQQYSPTYNQYLSTGGYITSHKSYFSYNSLSAMLLAEQHFILIDSISKSFFTKYFVQIVRFLKKNFLNLRWILKKTFLPRQIRLWSPQIRRQILIWKICLICKSYIHIYQMSISS